MSSRENKKTKGLLITFEGIDGCGKSTMISAAKHYIEAHNFSVLATLEPGGSDLGQEFRRMLLDSAQGELDMNTETLLFLADRSRHVNNIIKPALYQGQIVISDRYIDSTVAYQGGGRGIDLDTLINLNDFAIDGAYPDLTILLSLPVEQALSRLEGKKDRMEQEDIAFFKRVSDTYHLLAKRYPERFVIIDATGTIAEVTSAVLAVVADLLAGKERG